jgi:hypothetical protein
LDARQPRSHWLYITNLHETEQRAAISFKETRALTAEEVMLVELRVGGDGKGACTLAPPSVHPSGEDITWDEDGNPAEVDGAELKRCVAKVGAAALLVRHYPHSGARHAAALVLGGFLARVGLDEEQIAEFVESVANAANDEEVDDRVAAAKSAVKLLANGDDTPGLPRMREEWGQAVADLFAEWIGYDTPSAQRKVSLDDRIVERIAELARLSKVDYDRARVQVAKELGIRKATLDEEVTKQRAAQAQRAEAPPPPDIGKLAALSAEISASEDVLDLFAGDFGAVYANERRNAKLLYLVCTSRLFNMKETMHAAVKGTSAIGKSHLLSCVAAFFPPEDVHKLTSLSEKALFYIEEDLQHKIFIMAEAQDTRQLDMQNYIVRELISEGRLTYRVSVKIEGEIQSVERVIDGPVAFMTSTTKNQLHPENETRLLSLELDDSEAQTKRVMWKIALVEGRLGDGLAKVEWEPWHNFQRWLAAGPRVVYVPFASELARLTPPKTVRLRRDFAQLMHAIKAHALLHRQHRQQTEDGELIATIDDYAKVRELMGDILAEASEVKARPKIIETVAAVAAATEEEEVATVRAVADILKLDISAARRRLRAAEAAGYITNLETVERRPGRYKATGLQPAGKALLPRVDTLEEAYRRALEQEEEERRRA